VAPGLYARKRRARPRSCSCPPLLFVGGGLFLDEGRLPVRFNYFLSLSGNVGTYGVGDHAHGDDDDYLDFAASCCWPLGYLELPPSILFCRSRESLTTSSCGKFGRWFILIAFTVGAVLTRRMSPVKMIMSIPLCVLYFASIGLAYVFGKRPSRTD